ncbi:MAG: hypothetical protein AAFY33_04090 [Cyanobacteria bacterium J06643_4]
MAQPNSLLGADQATALPPSGVFSNPIGFVAPAILQSNQPPEVKQEMAYIAKQLATDPMAMRLFCDRIYQLLKDDLQAQQKRAHSYGKR